ncbi:MAG: hypothetical protein M1834_009057 [Cirrosporium novae-zelandiae]|nr:MAG: hypothetical protein M1834_009057 [Cirrosporium novae-zelandiae]
MTKRSREDSFSTSDSTARNIFVETCPVITSTDHSSKYTELDESAIAPGDSTIMQCLLPPHLEPIAFTSYEEFDVHYAKTHMNRCSECHKNFPTEHFLQLHIEENHDPLNEARRARGEKTNYDFFIVNDGVDKRSSMLRSSQGHRRKSSAASRAYESDQRSRRRSSSLRATTNNNSDEHHDNGSINIENPGAPPKNAMDNAQSMQAKFESQKASPRSQGNYQKQDDGVDALAASMSALNFVPRNVQFGRGKRIGFSRA